MKKKHLCKLIKENILEENIEKYIKSKEACIYLQQLRKNCK